MKTSPSAMMSFKKCNRHWWFTKKLNIKRKPERHHAFGTVFHGVVERFQAAGDNGEVPDPVPECLAGQTPGRPVEIYPEDWHVHEEGGVKIVLSAEEASIIRARVDECIEKGILKRTPGRQMEQWRGVSLPNGRVGGKADYRLPAQYSPQGRVEIHDWKTYSRGGQRFLKQSDPGSPNYLGKDFQVLAYAAMEEDAEVVYLQHNQIPKFEGGKVKTAHALVGREDIEAHKRVMDIILEEMKRVERIARWNDVDGPEDPGSCGFWFGSVCPFASVCSGVVTPEKLEARLKGATRPETGVSSMSIFDKLRKPAAASAPAKAPAPEVAPVKTSAPAKAPAPAPVAGAAPPWANATCPACRGAGFNSRGTPCPICNAMRAKDGGITSVMYVIEGEPGCRVASAIDPDAVEALGGALEWREGEEAAEPPKTRLTKLREQAQAMISPPAEPPEEEEEQEDEQEEPPKKGKAKSQPATSGRGRPKGKLRVFQGCFPVRGPNRPTVSVGQVLEEVGAEMAADMGAASYWELDPFKRRDRMRQRREVLADRYHKSDIWAPRNPDPDSAALLQALGSVEGVEVYEGL